MYCRDPFDAHSEPDIHLDAPAQYQIIFFCGNAWILIYILVHIRDRPLNNIERKSWKPQFPRVLWKRIDSEGMTKQLEAGRKYRIFAAVTST
jgi:hypothetical protein